MDNKADLPIFIKWIDFLKWLLKTTEKFPKKVRFTFSSRINNLALDMVEELVEARYTKYKIENLRRANLTVEKLRILLRISYEEKYLAHAAYKLGAHSLYEIGKMLGGWLKHQEVKR